MPKYGLTGGIASGKTVALQIFNEYGVDTIDTDELARLVIDRGTEGARKLEKAIGEQYFFDGALGPIGVWNRVLTAEEVALIYSGHSDSLDLVRRVAFFDFSEQVGDRASGQTVSGRLQGARWFEEDCAP